MFSSPSASGSEERGAEAALPPSSSSDTNTVAEGKLGNTQSLRVRMDSYPAGKQYLPQNKILNVLCLLVLLVLLYNNDTSSNERLKQFICMFGLSSLVAFKWFGRKL